MSLNDRFLSFPNHRVPASRYADYAVRDKGSLLLIRLDNPREIIRVTGPDNVQAAIEEIQAVLDPEDDGWRNVE